MARVEDGRITRNGRISIWMNVVPQTKSERTEKKKLGRSRRVIHVRDKIAGMKFN